MKPRYIFVASAFILASFLRSKELSASQPFDWPRFRGPDGTGISNETGILKSWPEEGPQELWRVPIGVGYSGIAVSENRVYTMDSQADSEFLVCLNAENGRELWRTRVAALYKDGQGDGPRSFPTLGGEIVYALSGNGILLAANAKTGNALWRLDIKDKFDFREPPDWWGFSMSPLLEGDKLLLQTGGSEDRCIVALNKESSETLWTTHSDLACYSTPIAIDINGHRQFVFVTANNVVSVSDNGEINWTYPWQINIIKIAMPVFVPPDKIFVSASYDIGAVLLRINDSGKSVEEVWSSKVMRNHFHSSILIDDNIFGFDNATLKCIESETGKQRWAKRRLGKGSLIYADGHFIVLSERGKLVLIEANPDQYIEKASVQVFKGKTWTAPTLSDGRLYLRDQKEIVCLALREK